MTRWGSIAAIAVIFGASGALADEASVSAALNGRPLSSAVGVSSYYGAEFHGRRTADGEIFDMHGLSAAHKTLPIPCYARVTNLRNGRSVVVRVNDRGPYVGGRMLDVSERVARLLAFGGGMARVKLDYLGMAGPSGAGDQLALLASLRTGATAPVIAKAEPDEGVSSVERTAPALGYAATATHAPAAAALEAAVRPAATVTPEPLSVAAKLDASVRQLEAALETTHQAAQHAAHSLSPYGELVVGPFKRLVEEASR